MNPVVAEARRWIGTPYVHGVSVCGAGTDCLGLVRGVWRAVRGAEPEVIPTYTADWSEPQGAEVLMQAATRLMRPIVMGAPLAPGEVLLFRMRERSVAKHLGIVSVGGSAPRFVHAYCGQGVVESSLSAPWIRRIAGRFEIPSEE